MVEYPVRRVAAILLTALMLFSTIIVVMPQSTASAASETNDIILKVLDNDLNIITTASVRFTEVHTGQVITAVYAASGDQAYHAGSTTPSGWYRVDVTASRFYSYKDVTGFKFDGTSPKTLNLVTLTKFGTDQYMYTVAVKDKSDVAVSGALVKLYNRTLRQDINSSTANSAGVAIMKAFGGASFDLVVTAQNYEMNVTAIGQINAPGSITVKLNDSVLVYRDVKKYSGTGTTYASNVVSYLYNTNTALPWEKRIMKSTGSSARFDVFAGSWILIIDGSDVNPLVQNLNLVAVDSIATVVLSNQTQSYENRTLTWNTWNSLAVENQAMWNADKTYAGLDFSDIGLLRAQVDLALGDADGTVDGSEWPNFSTYVVSTHEPDWISTGQWLHVQELGAVNRTQYISTTWAVNDLTNLGGSVINTARIVYKSTVNYNTQVTLNSAADFYQATFNATFDSSSMNRSFLLQLRTNYEMVGNTTDSALVTVTGYHLVTVNPLFSAVAGTAHMTLSIDKSAPPVAKGELIDQPNTYAHMVDKNVSYYVVKVNTNVSFSSLKSTDPNGNPLTYNWTFGDGDYAKTKLKAAFHNYTTIQNVTVNLTVTDVVGFSNYTTFKVSVDGRNPRPATKIMNMTGSILTLPVTIDQGDSLKFSPSGSVDDLLAINDGDGIIYSYKWQFGSDAPYEVLATATDQNQTHVFDTAGAIKVVLNVTDVVGNWKNTTVTITVKDKTGPTVNTLTTLNATWGVTLLERSMIYFDATETTDNIDNVSLLEFNWTFGDHSAKIGGVGLSFANVTHNYSSYGQYDMILNVTDTSGNNVSITRTLYIGMGKRPDVYPDQVIFEPTTFEESVSGKITVNITNKGSANATGITIELWWYSGTTAQKRIGNITTLYNATGTQVTSLGVGESGYGVLNWVPDAKGNYTIRAIVNSTDQPSSNWGQGTVEVKEASWKGVVVPVGLIVLIVAIPLILLARRRIGSMGAMIRRPKSEKEGKERKEEK
jgi:hypothetical protein